MNGSIYTVDEFNEYVENDLTGFVTQVCLDVANRSPTEAEMRAMASSYPEVSQVLAAAALINPKIRQTHIAMMKFEYKLPSAPAWCDLVLLGEGNGRKQVFIIELKDWYANTSDQPGVCEGVMYHQGHNQEHPSDQVRGYVQYCKNFHSAVVDESADVSGCVFFTRNLDISPYVVAPNDKLTIEYPMFNRSHKDGLAEFLLSKISDCDGGWAVRFLNGYYQQNRNILKQVAESFSAHAESRPFVLLDRQRYGYNMVLHCLTEAVTDKDAKRVIIVSGPPGSGKSAIALNLWAEAVRRFVGNTDGEHPGNVVFVATSSSQNDNWKNIFESSASLKSAGGLVMRSNNFNPGMTGGTMKSKYLPVFSRLDAKYVNDDGSALRYEYYEDYTQYLIDHDETRGYKDNLHFLSIIDEAHALINPLAPQFSTNSLGGWCMQMGPQAYHIIRESRVSVFFMDGEQSFRDNETTTVADIMALAARLKASVDVIDLSGMQFRCAGSAEYVEWAESLLTESPKANVNQWKDLFDVRVFDATTQMESFLRDKIRDGNCARLLSSCTVNWISDKTLDEMHTKVNYDFDFENEDGTRFRRHWNNPKRMDIFVQAPEYTKMHEDPLCEVGCPYEIRGFDFDWVGILWLGDVVWRSGKWMLDLNRCVDRANKSSVAKARKEVVAYCKLHGMRIGAKSPIPLVPLYCDELPQVRAFAKTVLQAYRILLTRAVKGVCLYIKDPETRKHVKDVLAQGGLVNG